MSRDKQTENVERELAGAKRVNLVDANGLTRIWVHTGKDGPKLVLLDKGGEPRAVLFVNEGGPMQITFQDKGGLWADINEATDKMYLNLYDEEGKAQPCVGVGDLPPIVELCSAEDSMQVVIHVGAADLEFLLHDREGKKRASLVMGKDRGRLSLFDEKGDSTWSAP
jgi:hypothetical protein